MASLPPIEISSDELFRSHNTLPPLPQIVMRIQDIMQNDNFNVNEIATLVSGDVALSAQILKIVNSAYYGLRREVSDLKIAIAFLGINEIYRIVLTLHVISGIETNNEEEIKSFWYRSYYTALCVKLLASKYSRYLDRDELWSAALLHDIGSLVYLKFYPDHYKAIREHGDKEKVLYSQAESKLSMPASATFGSLLCSYWKLPDPIKLACEFHTYESLQSVKDSDPNADYKKIIALASLSTDFTIRDLNEELKSDLTKMIINLLEIKEHEFLLLMGEIRDLQLEVENFMKVLF